MILGSRLSGQRGESPWLTHQNKKRRIFAVGKKQSADIDMDPEQIQAMENLRRVQKTQSRVRNILRIRMILMLY